MVECDTCGRRFVHGAAAAQHMTAVVHWPYEFETCNFESCYEEEVQEHMDELAHRAPKFECETCSFTSHYEEDDQDHMDEHDHWAPTFECEACTSKFRTAQQARSHMDSSNHWRANWCKQCQRGFQNPNNLRMVSWYERSKLSCRSADTCISICAVTPTTPTALPVLSARNSIRQQVGYCTTSKRDLAHEPHKSIARTSTM